MVTVKVVTDVGPPAALEVLPPTAAGTAPVPWPRKAEARTRASEMESRRRVIRGGTDIVKRVKMCGLDE